MKTKYWYQLAIVILWFIAVAVFSLSTGCRDTRYALELQASHESSASQHLTNPPTNFGWDVISAGMVLHNGNWRVEVTDGYIVDKLPCPNCPREDFHFTITREFPIEFK